MRVRHPSPAFVIAVLALFVALSGTAFAAGIVPLAKRAFSADKAKVADNAKKLGGKTAAQISAAAAALPGPAASVAGLVSIRTGTLSLAPGGAGAGIAACAAGEKAAGGGMTLGSGTPLALASGPGENGAGWTVFAVNLSDTEAATATVQAVCIK